MLSVGFFVSCPLIIAANNKTPPDLSIVERLGASITELSFMRNKTNFQLPLLGISHWH